MTSGSIGDAVRAARLKRGLTQVELAAKLGVGRTQLENIESDRFAPSIYTVQEVADACRVRIYYADGRWGIRRLVP